MASLADSFDAKALNALMTKTGPICKCVFIPAAVEDGGAAGSSSSSSVAGQPEEVELDMTPKVCAPAVKLGGNATFCAAYPEIDVQVLKLRAPAEGTATNTYKLPAPFHEIEVVGPMLLIRMDENSEPKDFTLKEFTEYSAVVAKNPPPAFDMSNEDEMDGEEASDDEEDFEAMLLERVVAMFKQTQGREPTEEEKKALLEKLMESAQPMMDDDEEDDEEEDEESTDAPVDEAPPNLEAMIRAKLTETLRTQLGRDPTEEELEEVLEELQNDQTLQTSLMAVETAAPKEEPAAAAVLPTNEPVMEGTLAAAIRSKVVEVLGRSLGREPTEEEIEETLETLSNDTQFHSALANEATAGSPSASDSHKRDAPASDESTPSLKRQRTTEEASPDCVVTLAGKQ
jgi:hypothetical protein